MGQGYIFTGVCDSVHRGVRAWSGGVCMVRGMHGPGGCNWSGGGGVCLVRGPGWDSTPKTATAAGGTHPTGMHSCFFIVICCENSYHISYNYNYMFQNTANSLWAADSASRIYLMFGHVHKLPLETRECGANKDEAHTHLSDGNICISF